MIVCLVGRVNTGKSTLLAGLVGLADRPVFRGVIAHGQMVQGQKGFVLELVPTGQRHELNIWDEEASDATELVRIGKFRFRKDVFDRAAAHVIECLNAANEDEWTIVDEIGPLELCRGIGLSAILPHLTTTKGNVLVIVREEIHTLFTKYIRTLAPDANISTVHFSQALTPTDLLHELV